MTSAQSNGTRDTKWPAIHRMWHADLTTVAIGHALGMTASQVRTEMTFMRKAGWDLPRRRISDQGALACAEGGRKSTGGGRRKESS